MERLKKISCHVITYNQKAYISKCIDGILMQIVDFSIEIIIGDDNSTDGTREILLQYAAKYPDKIKLNLRNLRGEGIPGKDNFVSTLAMCKGEYISLCDGDDYWTDPLKLQKQVDFLENNKDYVLCFHPVKVLKSDGEIVDDFITYVPKNYETIDTLARLGNYIHTPSVVFRNIITELPFEFQLSPIGDYFLYIILAQYGKLKYLDEKMSVYRYNVGIISKMSNLDIANNNVKMYSCMIGYVKDENVKKIIIDKQIKVVTEHYQMIETSYHEAFVSHHFLFLKMKKIIFYSKDPKLFLKRIKKKFKFWS